MLNCLDFADCVHVVMYPKNGVKIKYCEQNVSSD